VPIFGRREDFQILLNLLDGGGILLLVSFESDWDRPVEESLEYEGAMLVVTLNLVTEFISEVGFDFHSSNGVFGHLGGFLIKINNIIDKKNYI